MPNGATPYENTRRPDEAELSQPVSLRGMLVSRTRSHGTQARDRECGRCKNSELRMEMLHTAVTYSLVHELVYISLYECARSCAVAIKAALPPAPAPAPYDHTSIARAEALQRFKRSCRSEVVQRPLNFEELSNHTRPPLNPTGATLLNILGVVGRNDVLTRLGVVHDGLGVREEAIEAPVEDAGGDEGVDVADVEAAQGEWLAWLRPSCARRWLAASSLRASCLWGRGKGREEAHRC